MEAEFAQLREIAKQIANSARSGSDVSKPSAEGMLLLLKLKSSFKHLSKSTDELKSEAGQGKLQLEQADLQLQNLLYEKQYYDKEIRGCLNSRSAVSDEQISLQTEEEFWQQADDDLQAKAKAQGTEHELMLQRLAHETRLRKKMVKELDGLKAKKNQLLLTVTQQQKTLKELQSSLKVVGESAKPLQSSLSGYPQIRSSRLADLLPLPLYVLFSQLLAGREAMGLQISVSISGAQDEAESLSRQATETQEVGGIGTGEQNGASAPGQESNSSKRLKLDVDCDHYKEHPLKVDLELIQSSPSGGASSAAPLAGKSIMTVHFQYLMNLKVVTASASSPADDQLLASLFPTDDGSNMPTESLLHLEGGTFKFDSKRPARPYRWCQHLAGLDFVPTLPVATLLDDRSEKLAVLEGLETYRRQQRVVNLVSRLRALKEAAASLNTLLASLLKSPVPQDMSMYPRQPSSTISSWSDITPSFATSSSSSARATSTPAAKRAAAGSQLATPAAKFVNMPPGFDSLANGSGNAGTEKGGRAAKGEMMDGGLEEGDAGEGPEGTPALEEEEEGAYYEDMMLVPDTPAAGERNLAAAYWAVHAEGLAVEADDNAGAPPPVPKPVYRLYRCVLRSPASHAAQGCGQLELEVRLRVFIDYPSRPPLLRVMSLRELPLAPGKGHAKELLTKLANLAIWMEREANLTAISLVPPSRTQDMLLYQITHLRLCFDELVSQHRSDVAAAQGSRDLDLWALVKARQRLQGRDRHPPSVALPT